MIKLPNVQIEDLAHAADYTTAATVLTIPSNAKPWAKAVFRHVGGSGFWYGKYAGGTPTTSSYDFKLAPGDPTPGDNPPLGAINLLASGAGIGDIEFSAAWSTG